MKRFTTLLLACLSSLALISCEKIEPVEIPEPQKEEERQPEENNDNSDNNDQTTTMIMNITAGGKTITATLGFSLTSHNEQVTAVSGDIMLYNGNNICVFYGNNSWSYTPLGKVDGLSADELKAFFGTGDVSVTFSMKQ